MNYKIYLAKDGKTHGPFTPEEFETLRSSGAISNYDAIFDSRSNTWQNLEVPPAPAPAPQSTPPAAPKAATAPTPAPRSASLSVRSVEAVCHNFRSVVAGHLARVTEMGCDLVTEVREAGPCFAEKGQVFLSLLDPSTGKAMEVTAHLITISRSADGGWTYRLEWPNCPAILLAA